MPVPTFDKNKKKKARKLRLIIFGLCVAVAGLAFGIYYSLNKVGSLSTIFQSVDPNASSQAILTPVPEGVSRCSVAYTDWLPYFFRDKLIYCDSNFHCKVKTEITVSQLSYADRFSDGLARLSLKEAGKPDSIVYIGTSGKIEIPSDASRDTSGPFSEGLAYSVDKASGKLGFIDKKGNYSIPPKFVMSHSTKQNTVNKISQLENCFFSSGLAPVYNEKVNTKFQVLPSCGYIDHSGKFVIPTKFVEGCAFVGSRARVCVKDESQFGRRWGYIDPKGTFIITPVYMQAQNFSNDLAAVLDYQGRWGFIDKNGKFVIAAKYSDINAFSEGIAAASVTTDKKLWGYLRKNGIWLIEPQFENAEDFHGGEAHASNGDADSKSKEDFWINANGKVERHRRQLIPFDI